MIDIKWTEKQRMNIWLKWVEQKLCCQWRSNYKNSFDDIVFKKILTKFKNDIR